jgi:hypothetical protein
LIGARTEQAATATARSRRRACRDPHSAQDEPGRRGPPRSQRPGMSRGRAARGESSHRPVSRSARVWGSTDRRSDTRIRRRGSEPPPHKIRPPCRHCTWPAAPIRPVGLPPGGATALIAPGVVTAGQAVRIRGCSGFPNSTAELSAGAGAVLLSSSGTPGLITSGKDLTGHGLAGVGGLTRRLHRLSWRVVVLHTVCTTRSAGMSRGRGPGAHSGHRGRGGPGPADFPRRALWGSRGLRGPQRAAGRRVPRRLHPGRAESGRPRRGRPDSAKPRLPASNPTRC